MRAGTTDKIVTGGLRRTMTKRTLGTSSPSEGDLDFLAAAAAPEGTDRRRLARVLEEDEDFRAAFIGDERTFRRLISDEDALLTITPKLYFEILLRKSRKELEGSTHTIERGGTGKIAVFDTREVVDLLSREEALTYLADMLSSFTRIESYTVSFPVRPGIRRKVRFNDLDIDSLESLCEWVGEEHRLAFYKRIADICLFLPGVFPEYVRYAHRYPATGEARPPIGGRTRRSLETYVEEGRRFYRLAAEHPAAKSLEISEVFRLFHENFLVARKPLTFIAERYLHHRKQRLFGN